MRRGKRDDCASPSHHFFHEESVQTLISMRSSNLLGANGIPTHFSQSGYFDPVKTSTSTGFRTFGSAKRANSDAPNWRASSSLS